MSNAPQSLIPFSGGAGGKIWLTARSPLAEPVHDQLVGRLTALTYTGLVPVLNLINGDPAKTSAKHTHIYARRGGAVKVTVKVIIDCAMDKEWLTRLIEHQLLESRNAVDMFLDRQQADDTLMRDVISALGRRAVYEAGAAIDIQRRLADVHEARQHPEQIPIVVMHHLADLSRGRSSGKSMMVKMLIDRLAAADAAAQPPSRAHSIFSVTGPNGEQPSLLQDVLELVLVGNAGDNPSVWYERFAAHARASIKHWPVNIFPSAATDGTPPSWPYNSSLRLTDAERELVRSQSVGAQTDTTAASESGDSATTNPEPDDDVTSPSLPGAPDDRIPMNVGPGTSTRRPYAPPMM